MSRPFHKGLVKRFNNDHGAGGGFGFLTLPNGTDIFVHRTAIAGAGERELYPGDEVSFQIIPDQAGQLRARNVRVQLRAPQPNPQHLRD